jgi:2-phosphoglycerate kinase
VILDEVTQPVMLVGGVPGIGKSLFSIFYFYIL